MDEVASHRRASRWGVFAAYVAAVSVIGAVHWMFRAPSPQAFVASLFCVLLFVSTLRVLSAFLDAGPHVVLPNSKRSWQSIFRLSKISSAPVSTLTAMVGAYCASGSVLAAFAFTRGMEIDTGGAATQLTVALIAIPLYRASHACLDR